ncbi:MAG: hypothetical protein HWD58_10880 [Bacteroidota bacterium]|nr:MAG: hypothetical protein HWD58_10880 [Bacteroidota bacterium]
MGDTMWVDAQGYTYIGTRAHLQADLMQSAGEVHMRSQAFQTSAIQISSGSFSVEDSAIVNVTGPFNMNGGTLNILSPGGAVSPHLILNSQLIIDSGSVNLQDSSMLDVQRIEVSHGGTFVTAEPSQVVAQQGIYSLQGGVIYQWLCHG